MSTRNMLFMKRALELASRGEGLVSPNPMVGAVIVKDSRVIGEGFHLYERLKHAEAYALEEAGSAAEGATLYCSLEPCCHDGRTPPCTDAIIASRLARVVLAVADPDARVNGKGIDLLVNAGIEVKVGLCAEEAMRQNECYMKHIRTNTPFLHVILPPGDDRWSPSAGLLKMLACYDALVVAEAGVAARTMVRSVSSQSKHRPFVVVLPEDEARAFIGAANVTGIDFSPVLRSQFTFTAISGRLKASAATSAAILAGGMLHEEDVLKNADKVTGISGAGARAPVMWRGRPIPLVEIRTDTADGVIETTGYPRRSQLGSIE